MRDSYDEAVHYRGGHDPNIVRVGKTETIARRVASLLAMAFCQPQSSPSLSPTRPVSS